MAATWRSVATNVLFAQNKTMLSVFNAVGSGVVLRPYRMWILNNQTTAVVGVLTNLDIRKITSTSGGTDNPPVAHDLNSSALPAQVTSATNSTVTPTDYYRRVIWSTDEPLGNATMTIDEFETFPTLCCVWSMGYAYSALEPITLREGEGVAIINSGAVVGAADFIIEFTRAAS